MIGIFIVLIQTLFIGLKLMHEIDWSWWWVFTPLIAVGVFWVLLVTYLAYLDKQLEESKGW